MTPIPGGNEPRPQLPGPVRPVPPHRRPSPVVALAAGAMALLLGTSATACGTTRHAEPTATVQATSTCTTPGINGCPSQEANGGSAAKRPGDPAQALPASATQACDLNDQMRKTATNEDLRDQGAAISQIQALAGDSTIVDIKAQANTLKNRYDTAVTATDDPASYAATINLFTASTQLATACLKAGWRS